MSMVIEKIPTMSDEDLLALFHNAARLLSKGPNLAAESVIKAIEREWKKRLDRARAGTRSTARPNDGMLATLGYRVGSVNGEKTPIRRQILKLVLEQLQLPIVGSPAYTDEWGAPNSSKRYEKLIRFLESQLTNPGNINRPNMEKAMIEWAEDLEWVQRTYAHLAK
jgi:hypothetical protein